MTHLVDMTQETRALLMEILRDALTIEVDVGYGYYSERTVRVKLKLDGETISEGYDTLPTPTVSY